MSKRANSPARLALWILSYRDVLVATICAVVVFAALDVGWGVSLPVFFAIGWFVPRNARP